MNVPLERAWILGSKGELSTAHTNAKRQKLQKKLLLRLIVSSRIHSLCDQGKDPFTVTSLKHDMKLIINYYRQRIWKLTFSKRARACRALNKKRARFSSWRWLLRKIGRARAITSLERFCEGVEQLFQKSTRHDVETDYTEVWKRKPDFVIKWNTIHTYLLVNAYRVLSTSISSADR